MPGWDDVALGILIHLGDVLAEGGTPSMALNVSVPGLPEDDLAMLDRYARALSGEVERMTARWRTLDDEGKARYMGSILLRYRQQKYGQN